MSKSSQAALVHLRTIKPSDGWSVKKTDGKGFQLLRRNVSLSENYYSDIHYCPTKNVVVGILTSDGSASACQLLVDEKGRPVNETKVMSVNTYDPNGPSKIDFSKSRSQAAPRDAAQRSKASSSPGDSSPISSLTPEQNKQLIQYGLMFIGALIVLKVLAKTNLGALYMLALPLIYVYAMQTCPSAESFDAKKELKRVLRGHHLPENHPEKPKGWFEEMTARVTASVTAEIATFPGYELEMTNLAGAAWLADVRVPSAKTQCYWIGAFDKWYYVTSFDTPERRQAAR
mmetsp:Transcript_115199/g.332776  ORF Transcript_115199/g.332776 Transcript_115199/m.332776 type:complete len:287 (+) Transcript_115199:144-1004(+)